MRGQALTCTPPETRIMVRRRERRRRPWNNRTTNMTVKIDKRIIGYAVKKAASPETESAPVSNEPKPVEMNETIERPDFLLGTTYKIKPPISEHALYITINDIILKDRKSTRLNSSHVKISYAVFCLKKK